MQVPKRQLSYGEQMELKRLKALATQKERRSGMASNPNTFLFRPKGSYGTTWTNDNV